MYRIMIGMLLVKLGLWSIASAQEEWYDRRERIAATLTQEWSTVRYLRFNAQYLQRLSENADPTYRALLEKTSEVHNFYRIVSSADAYAVETLQQLVGMPDDSKPLHVKHLWYSFRLNRSQWRTLVLLYEVENPHQVASVYASGTSDRFGLLELVTAEIPGVVLQPHMLVYLLGFSPLRLFSASPDRWKLKSVSENEWVYEAEQLQDVKKIVVHLDRTRQDAPSLVRIEYRDGAVRLLRTVEYRQFEGVWLPSKVEEEFTGGVQEHFSIHTLLKAYRNTDAVARPLIPKGTRTFVWTRTESEERPQYEAQRKGWDDSLFLNRP